MFLRPYKNILDVAEWFIWLEPKWHLGMQSSEACLGVKGCTSKPPYMPIGWASVSHQVGHNLGLLPTCSLSSLRAKDEREGG